MDNQKSSLILLCKLLSKYKYYNYFVLLSLYLNTKLDYWDEFYFLLRVFYVKIRLLLSVLNFCRARCMHVLTQMQRNQSQVQCQLKTLVCVNSPWMQIHISNIHGWYSLRSPGKRASENDWEVYLLHGSWCGRTCILWTAPRLVLWILGCISIGRSWEILTGMH